MEGSFTDAASGSIVLGTLTEKNKPSYAAIHCPNLLSSPSTAEMLKSGRKWRFPRVWTAPTNRMLAGFALAASGSFLLEATGETNEPSVDVVPCFSRSQSASAAATKKTPVFANFFGAPRPERMRSMDLS